MSVLHFNHASQKLETISSYTIDKQIIGGANGKQLKEVAYISFDSSTKTMVIVFRENYVLTVNFDERKC